jgi:hypothetical protein
MFSTQNLSLGSDAFDSDDVRVAGESRNSEMLVR